MWVFFSPSFFQELFYTVCSYTIRIFLIQLENLELNPLAQGKDKTKTPCYAWIFGGWGVGFSAFCHYNKQ